jgi:colanic acid biosynthesis glycosyl transferase WcaI
MLRRTPVVYDIQDMWPDTLRATGMVTASFALRLVGALCSWVYRRVDHIAVLSPGFKRLLVERGVPERKIDVIYNWADEESLVAPRGALPAAFPGPDRFRIVFAGNMGKAQRLETVLEAAALLQARGSRVSFVLVGGGVEVASLKDRALELGLSNVVFVPPVPMTEIGGFLAAADALLVHLRKDPLFEITIPSKIQAYMAMGRPLLLAIQGDGADLVRRSGGGVLAEPESPQSIAEAADSLAQLPAGRLEEMGRNARRFYSEYLSIDKGTMQFAGIFERLAAGRRPG